MNLASQAWLKKSDLNHWLTRDELKFLLKKGKKISFAKGETILIQGKFAPGIYILLKGSVSVDAKILGKGTTHLATLDPGNVFGEISFIEKIPCVATIIANNQVKCLLLNELYFNMLTAYSPVTKYKLLEFITKQVCQRLKRMHDKIIKNISNTKKVTQSLFPKLKFSLIEHKEITLTKKHFPIDYLKKFNCFSSFTENEISELIKYAKLVRAPKHHILIHKQETRAYCYIIVKGAVQSCIFRNKKLGKLSVLSPGILFADVACFDKSIPFDITFITCEKAVLFMLSEEMLHEIKTQKIKLWYKLFSLINHSIILLEKSVNNLDLRINILE